MRNQTRTIIALASAAWMSFSTASLAQEAGADTKTRSSRGYFMPGASILDLDNLNAKLQSTGYPSFSDNLFSLGGGGHSIINRFIIGGEGHGLMTSDKDFTLANRNYKNKLDAGYGFFNLGYQIIANGGFSLYPLIGIGGGHLKLKITERASPSFDDVLANPNRSAELSTGGLLLHASLGFDHLVGMRRDGGRQGGFMLGLRAGYIFAPLKDDWRLNASEIAGGPELSVTGSFVRLMIGGGHGK